MGIFIEEYGRVARAAVLCAMEAGIVGYLWIRLVGCLSFFSDLLMGG